MAPTRSVSATASWLRPPRAGGSKGISGQEESGGKSRIITDRMGFLVRLSVHTADIQNLPAGLTLGIARAQCRCFPQSAAAVPGCPTSLPTAAMPDKTYWPHLAGRADTAQGFKALPHPWVVGRTFAWLGRTSARKRLRNLIRQCYSLNADRQHPFHGSRLAEA